MRKQRAGKKGSIYAWKVFIAIIHNNQKFASISYMMGWSAVRRTSCAIDGGGRVSDVTLEAIIMILGCSLLRLGSA